MAKMNKYNTISGGAQACDGAHHASSVTSSAVTVPTSNVTNREISAKTAPSSGVEDGAVGSPYASAMARVMEQFPGAGSHLPAPKVRTTTTPSIPHQPIAEEANDATPESGVRPSIDRSTEDIDSSFIGVIADLSASNEFSLTELLELAADKKMISTAGDREFANIDDEMTKGKELPVLLNEDTLKDRVSELRSTDLNRDVGGEIDPIWTASTKSTNSSSDKGKLRCTDGENDEKAALPSEKITCTIVGAAPNSFPNTPFSSNTSKHAIITDVERSGTRSQRPPLQRGGGHRFLTIPCETSDVEEELKKENKYLRAELEKVKGANHCYEQQLMELGSKKEESDRHCKLLRQKINMLMQTLEELKEEDESSHSYQGNEGPMKENKLTECTQASSNQPRNTGIRNSGASILYDNLKGKLEPILYQSLKEKLEKHSKQRGAEKVKPEQ